MIQIDSENPLWAELTTFITVHNEMTTVFLVPRLGSMRRSWAFAPLPLNYWLGPSRKELIWFFFQIYK